MARLLTAMLRPLLGGQRVLQVEANAQHSGPLSRAVLRGGPCPVPAEGLSARGVPASRSLLGHAVQVFSPLPRWLLTLLSIPPEI